jgi:5-azacytidine-induced protein 1
LIYFVCLKEQTVRGLEPEVQRLMSRHASELADLESERDRRLASLERELHQRHIQNVRDLRAQWEDEQQDAWQRERQLLSQR